MATCGSPELRSSLALSRSFTMIGAKPESWPLPPVEWATLGREHAPVRRLRWGLFRFNLLLSSLGFSELLR
jgi:hypothetical protein